MKVSNSTLLRSFTGSRALASVFTFGLWALLCGLGLVAIPVALGGELKSTPGSVPFSDHGGLAMPKWDVQQSASAPLAEMAALQIMVNSFQAAVDQLKKQSNLEGYLKEKPKSFLPSND